MTSFRFLIFALLASALIGAPLWATGWTLSRAVRRGLKVQAAVASSREDLRAASDLARGARADRLPELFLQSASIWTQSRDGQPLYVAANGAREVIGEVAVDVPLYAPELRALSRLARNRAAVARSELRLARLQVAARIVNAWFRLALAENHVAIWRQTVAYDRSLYERTRRAYRAGASARLNVVQTHLLLIEAGARYAQNRTAEATARRALNLELGMPASASISVLWPAKPLVPSPLRQLWRNAVRFQPLIRAARRRVLQGRSEVRVQRTATLPTVQGYVAYGVDTATAPEARDLGWQAGVDLSLPLFGFGRYRERLAAAHAHLSALRQAKNALVLQIRQRINRDYGLFRRALESSHRSAEVAREARRVYWMTLHGFRNGALNALVLSQAQTDLIQAELAGANARIEERMAGVQLLLDEGRLPR